MNSWTGIGRITADPEIRYSNGETPIAYGSFTVAIDRPTRSGADKITDFIYCKVVGKNAEFAEKYLRKGMKIGIVGRIQIDKYTDNAGQQKSTIYVQIQNMEFCESKSSVNTAPAPSPSSAGDGFMNIPDGIDEELPFC